MSDAPVGSNTSGPRQLITYLPPNAVQQSSQPIVGPVRRHCAGSASRFRMIVSKLMGQAEAVSSRGWIGIDDCLDLAYRFASSNAFLILICFVALWLRPVTVAGSQVAGLTTAIEARHRGPFPCRSLQSSLCSNGT